MKNIFTLTLILLISSCNKDIDPPSCGCGGPIWMTIPNEDLNNVPINIQTSGLIFFKDEDIIERYVPDDRWEERFWIFQGTEGCFNCQRKFIVCNEDILNSEFDFLKQENNSDSIPVIFNGNLMTACEDKPFIAPGDFFYAEIELTSIEFLN